MSIDQSEQFKSSNQQRYENPNPALIRCQFPSCDQFFVTQAYLEQHIKMQHVDKPKHYQYETSLHSPNESEEIIKLPYYGNLRPLLPNSNQQTNETTKPPLTYTQLIVQAIQSSPEKQLTSSAICTYISQNYPYYKMVDKSWKLGITTKLYKNPRFIKVPYYDHRHKKNFWKIQPLNNMQEKGLKEISTPQLTSEISSIVTSLSVAEEKRVAEALDTSGISFEHDETVMKQEVGIKEEKESKPNILIEAGPSKESNNTCDITVKTTQNIDLFKCHVCDQHFNQYDLELHFVTDHIDEELF